MSTEPSAEEQLVTAVTAVHAEAERMANDARSIHERAKGEVEAAEAMAASTTSAHVDAPDDKKLATAALAAEATLSLARKRLSAAQERASRADEALAGASRALAEGQREMRRAELRVKAAPATLAAAVDEPTRQLLAAFDVFRSSLEAIRSAHVDSVAASAELRSLGEHQSDLHSLHVFAALYTNFAARGLTPGGQANAHLDTLGLHFSAPYITVDDVVNAARIMADMRRPSVTAEWAPASLSERIARFREGRTHYDFINHENAIERARQAGAVPPTLPPAPSMNGRISYALGREDGQ